MTDYGELLHFVTQAHQRAARDNENLSSQALRAAGAAGVPFQQAVITALSTLGEIHGPTRQARAFIYGDFDGWWIERSLKRGEVIPGWGNSFHKHDPAWADVIDYLTFVYPSHIERLEIITKQLHAAGKDIHPNAAAYTAVTAEILDVPPGTELQIVIQARVPVWAEQWAEAHGQAREIARVG